MSELIPDPTDRLAPAIVSDDDGSTRLAPVVMFRAADSDDDWQPLGWLTDPNAFMRGDDA